MSKSKLELILEHCKNKGMKTPTCSSCAGTGKVEAEWCLTCLGEKRLPNKWQRIHNSVTELQADIISETNLVAKARAEYLASQFGEKESKWKAKDDLDQYVATKKGLIKARIIYLLKSAGMI